MQGAMATITAHGVEADVDVVDFDAEDMARTMANVESALGLALDEDRVEALAAEAAAAGDSEMVHACQATLDRSPAAARIVWRAIDAAKAMA